MTFGSKIIPSIKPNKLKILIAGFLTIAYIVFLLSSEPITFCKCQAIVNPFDCSDLSPFLILKTKECYCGCASTLDVLNQYFEIVLLPFLAIYVIISFIEFFFLKYKNHYKDRTIVTEKDRV